MRWDAFDVAFMGTSLTARLTAKKWIDAFQSRTQLQTQRPFRTYDFGSPGKASDYGVTIVSQVVAMKPKVAVIEYAMNDAVTTSGISVAAFQSNLVLMLQAFWAGSPATKLFLMTMNPAISPGTALVPSLASYYQGMRAVAAAQGVSLIDNTPSWGTPAPGDMLPDGIHPLDDPAVAVIVPNVTAAIAPLIV
ncbi:SGNH/GDSL hydrolase family protein [Rhizobium grahamii]|uniref:G-D-S-L family lipolytic protein n=1 Tax=Rhizobium grahamii CCGE 502 TaxID=990285 RepID=S3I8N8_9HYPH|nr:GDSL-type esterase/lipase family protein [Rhizobium grahamii]EPE95703.1 G-D-S-L family lipolytic protein [Rhizobium grahamii CCGE 502]